MAGMTKQATHRDLSTPVSFSAGWSAFTALYGMDKNKGFKQRSSGQTAIGVIYF